MKVLITGGAGFIGSHLVDAYLARGDEVVVVDDLSSGNKKNLSSALSAGAKFYELPVQSKELVEVFRKERPDLVNHHAAQKSVRDSVTNPIKDADINLLGLLSVLEAARASGTSRFIYSSSGGVAYGEQEVFPATEDHPKRPLSPYGVSKYASELYLDYYCHQFGMSATCLRYANIYGPRQDPDGEAGVVAIFSKRMMESLPTSIFGTGKQSRDFVFVADVVQANLLAEKITVGFKALNVGTAVETSILVLHQQLAQISGYKLPVKFEAAKSGEQMRSVLSAQRLHQLTGWTAKVDLAEGLRRTYEWFKKEA